MLKLLRLVLLLVGALVLLTSGITAAARHDQAANQCILYTKRYTEIHQICLNNRDRLLFTNPWPIWSFQPSPDGKWILAEKGDALEFYRLRMDGTQVQKIPIDPMTEYDSATWSPDGQWILVFLNAPVPEFHRIHPDGSDEQQFTGYFRRPVVSPDGQQIFFTEDYGTFIRRWDGTGSRSFPLYDNGLYPISLQWFPDGQWILFLANTDSHSIGAELYRIRADGTDLQLLTTCAGSNDAPDISPDGEWILFTDDWTLHRMRADGTNRQVLTPRMQQDAVWTPQFSPDGQWIIFRWLENNEVVIRRMRADGSESDVIAKGNGVGWPIWSPPIRSDWHPWRSIAAGIGLIGLAIFPWRKLARRKLA